MLVSQCRVVAAISVRAQPSPDGVMLPQRLCTISAISVKTQPATHQPQAEEGDELIRPFVFPLPPEQACLCAEHDHQHGVEYQHLLAKSTCECPLREVPGAG